jgi:putative sigma-54 modulation protein
MRLELTGRQLTITPVIRKLVDERLRHVLRLLNDSALSAQVVLTTEKTRYHADVTLHARGENFLHGEAGGKDIGAALGAAVDKIDRQARRLKERWKDHKRRAPVAPAAAAAAARPARKAGRAKPPAPATSPSAVAGARLRIEGEDGHPRVIRARRRVKPMSVDEAAVEVTNGGDPFLVFRNAATDAVNVLFRRPDGNLGLIEPEA